MVRGVCEGDWGPVGFCILGCESEGMSSAGLDFNPAISTGLDFNPAISAGLDFKPAGWGLGGGGWEMGGSEVGGCRGGEWGARRYIKRPAFYMYLRGPPGALPGTGHEKTRFQNKRETTPWAGTGPGKNQVPKIKPLGTGQKKPGTYFGSAEVPGRKKPGTFDRGLRYRAKKNQEAFSGGGHA